MRLSIVVPFWGVEKYFTELLNSLNSQTMKDVEFILVNDCSQDKSQEIAINFQKRDDRFVIVNHEQNKGQGGARNTGLDMARGKYIWFVDSDDVIRSKTAAMELISKMEADELDVLQFSSWRLNEDSPKGNFRFEPFQNEFVLINNSEIVNLLVQEPFRLYVVWDKVFRKDFLKKNECYALEKTVAQDGICSVWILNADRFGYVNKTYYYYRIRENSVSTSKKDASSYDHLVRVANQIEAYYYKFMNQNLSKRTFVLIRILDLLITSNTPNSCYRMSLKLDRKKILKKCVSFLQNSKLFNEEIEEGFFESVSNSFKDRNPKLRQVIKLPSNKNFNQLEIQIRKSFEYNYLIVSRAKYRMQMLCKGDLMSLKVIIKYVTPYLFIIIWKKISEKLRLNNGR